MTFTKKIFAAFALIGFGIFARLVPHVPNATPMTAVTLMGTRYLGRVWSLTIPLVAMFASDLIIGFYDWRVLASVYVSFALIAFVSWVTAKRGSVMLLSTAFGASLFFFLTTNAAVWAFSPLYAKTFAGLLLAYAMGLPFLVPMVVADLLYTGALFGVCEALERGAMHLVTGRLQVRAVGVAREVATD